MTVRELSQLYYLNREIDDLQRELEELRAKIGATTPKLSGMPHNPNGNVDSQTERLVADMVDLQAIIAAKQLQCIHERTRLERFIESVDESRLRMAFRLRFINGLSWRQVSLHLGDARCEESIKQQVYRYLKANKGKPERQRVSK